MGGRSPNKLVKVVCACCGCEFYIAEIHARNEVFCTLRCSEHRRHIVDVHSEAF